MHSYALLLFAGKEDEAVQEGEDENEEDDEE